MSDKRAAPEKPVKSLSDEIADALGSVKRQHPSPDELADRDHGSPGPIADEQEKP